MAKVGRPLKFNSVEEMQKQIDGYFANCDIQHKPYTITGLALALNTTRELLLEYENKDKFNDTIKNAKQKVENYAEEQLFTSHNTAGVIFNMVNNYRGKWVNKTENSTNIDGKVEIELNSDIKDLAK